MRHTIMTIYGRHGKGNIEMSATVNDNKEEYLSGIPVTGIALYIEQWNEDAVPAMSALICPDGKVELLCNRGFGVDFVEKMMQRIEAMKDDISDYIEEKEAEYA